MTTQTWTSGQTTEDGLPKRGVWAAMKRGVACRCPACGAGKLYTSYLKVTPVCNACGTDLSHNRADDAPPYFTILLVGHIIVPLVLIIETNWHPPVVWQLALYLPLTTLLCLTFLPRIKGAVVGYQWANYMHGFHPQHGEAPDVSYRENAGRG